MRRTGAKYEQSGQALSRADFAGDTRDQRGWGHWCALWLAEALRVSRPGSFLAMFCDWRQLPTATDAVQAGGWVWRGLIPWVKPGARPTLGRPTNSAEYVVWATNGAAPLEGECHPGYLIERVSQADKHHMTGKPTDVMRALVRLCPRGGVVIDPFAGSGTTLVAAALEGRRGLGFEITEHYAAVARDRIGAARAGLTTADSAAGQVGLWLPNGGEA